MLEMVLVEDLRLDVRRVLLEKFILFGATVSERKIRKGK